VDDLIKCGPNRRAIQNDLADYDVRVTQSSTAASATDKCIKKTAGGHFNNCCDLTALLTANNRPVVFHRRISLLSACDFSCSAISCPAPIYNYTDTRRQTPNLECSTDATDCLSLTSY